MKFHRLNVPRFDFSNIKYLCILPTYLIKDRQTSMRLHLPRSYSHLFFTKKKRKERKIWIKKLSFKVEVLMIQVSLIGVFIIVFRCLFMINTFLYGYYVCKMEFNMPFHTIFIEVILIYMSTTLLFYLRWIRIKLSFD